MTITREQALAELTAAGGPFEITRAVVDGIEQPVYAGAPASMREVLEATAAFGEREFLVYRDDRWTFTGHYQRAAALAHLLVDRGVVPGDRVAIGMRNYPEWVQAFWACQAIGAVAVTLNAWWTGEELEYALADSGAIAAVLDGERITRLAPHFGGLPLQTVLGVRDAVGAPEAESLAEVLTPYLADPYALTNSPT